MEGTESSLCGFLHLPNDSPAQVEGWYHGDDNADKQPRQGKDQVTA
jgi:hypothetical protein